MVRTSIQACGTATTTLAWPKPSGVEQGHAVVLRDLFAHQVLAGDAEMHRPLRQLRGDLGGRQVGDLDVVEARDRAAIVARAARLHRARGRRARRTLAPAPAAGPWREPRGSAARSCGRSRASRGARSRPPGRRPESDRRCPAAPACRRSARRRRAGGRRGAPDRAARTRRRCSSRRRGHSAVEKRMRADVDAAGGEKPGAAFEQVERGVERDAGIGRERAQMPPRPRRDRRRWRGTARSARASPAAGRAPAPSAACSRNRSAISSTDRPPTAVMPAIDRRSVTSACAACGSEPASAVSTPWYSGRAVDASSASRSRSCSRLSARLKSFTSRRFQAGGRSTRGDQRGEQADVAQADFRRRRGRSAAVASMPSESVSASAAAMSWRPNDFDAGLQELGRRLAAVAKHRAEIAEARRRPRGRGGEIVARDRYGQVGPQAEFTAGRVAGQEHAAADVLARQVEERLGRLQDGRGGARVSGALEMGQQRRGARVDIPRIRAHCFVHGRRRLAGGTAPAGEAFITPGAGFRRSFCDALNAQRTLSLAGEGCRAGSAG